MSTSKIHLLIGIMQGCLLLLFHEAIAHQWSFLASPEFAFPAYAIVITLPIIFLCCRSFAPPQTLQRLLALFAVILVLLGSYSGSLTFDEINKQSFAHIFIFSSSMVVLLYISLPFIQSYLRNKNWHFHYDDLYEFGWLNTVVFLIAIAFTALVWILLGLCAALFAMLSIDLFKDLFSDHNFIYPATAMMFCYGISLGLQHFNIGIIQRIDLFFRAVTVMTSCIVVLFLIALLVSGLKPLWGTKSGTFLILWLQVFIVLFTNSMVQRGYHERSESSLVRWSITLSLLAMPFFSAVSIYGMTLRIMQYGWTIDRVWAVLIIVVMAVYALGYAYAALLGFFKKSPWLAKVAPSNTYAAMLIMAIIILTNSPLLSPMNIASQSQTARLLSGEIKADDFDFIYLRFNLGNVGLDQLKQLSEIKDHPESARIQELAKKALLKKQRWERNTHSNTNVKESDVAQLFQTYPKAHPLDKELAHTLYEQRKKWPYSGCFEGDHPCFILYADLNRDQDDEAILFLQHQTNVFTHTTTGWHVAGTLNEDHQKSATAIQQAFQEQHFTIEPSTWDTLKIGDQVWFFKGEKKCYNP